MSDEKTTVTRETSTEKPSVPDHREEHRLPKEGEQKVTETTTVESSES